MNKDLQSILDFIQQSAHLSDEEKKSLAKSLKDANKELEITSFKLDRTEKVKRTTAILLEETIEELEKKRKAVEEQNHELEIESSLERVRTVAMSMRNPDDLLDICKIVYTELQTLNFSELRNTMINIHNDEKGFMLNYDYALNTDKTITNIPYHFHPLVEKQIAVTRNANDAFYEFSFSGEELKEFRQLRKNNGEQDDPKLEITDALHYYFYSIGTGSIGISTYTAISQEKLQVLKRFRNVFNLSYQRYIDLALAEVQAKEAKIEASLERMRAAAMSLRKSEELITVCEAMYKELTVLGFGNIRNAQIAIKSESRQSYFISEYSDHVVAVMQEAPYNSSPLVKLLYEEMENSKDALYQKEFSGKEFDEWRAWRKNVGAAIDIRIEQANSMCFYLYSFGKGYLGISTFNAITKDQLEVLKRFKNVFELSYTRYIDVAQAEAQAREAQIELALERVRARAMAMQKSGELAETASVLFKQLIDLGIKPAQMRTCAITTLQTDEPIGECWITSPDGNIIPQSFMVPYNETSAYKTIYAAWKNGEKFLVVNLSGDALLQHLIFLKKYAKIPTQQFQALPDQPKETFTHAMFFSQGYLFIISNEPLPEYHEIFIRFAKVFEQTYTRFLDLQKSEAQAREAQIQLTLERVRARTMAMQKSDELPDAANLLFQQMQALDMPAWSAGYCIWDENKKGITLWMSSEGVMQPSFHAPLTEDPSFIHFREAHERGESFHVEAVGGDELVSHYKYMRTLPGIGEILDSIVNAGHPLPTFQIFHCAYFSQGFLLFITYEPVPEAHDIFKRFAKVFEQTYTRFLDLQKSEAQARESQIQLALERVRARTMAMQKSDELSETVFILFQQFKQLGENPDQATIGIINEDEWVIEYWVTMYGSQTNRVYKFPISEPNVTNRIYNAWKEQRKSLVIELSRKELYDFAHFRESMGGAAYNPEEKKRVINVAFFSKGIINVQSNESRSEESIRLLERFAKVFEQTYTRFLDLQKAEAQARESQIQLALERIRARTMAMQKSDELRDVVKVVFKNLEDLQFAIDGAAFIGTPIENSNDINIWIGDNHAEYPACFRTPYYEAPSIVDMWNARISGSDFYYKTYSKEEKNIWFEYAFENTDYRFLPDHLKNWILGQDFLTQTFAMAKNSSIGIHYHTKKELSENEIDILKRFSKVFDQSYIRFLDLQKAEAQARESQIEVALERVRSRSMAMQKSEELKEVIQVVYEQFVHLNIQVEHTGFIMDYKERDDMHIWLADMHEVPSEISIPYFDSPHWNSFKEAKKKGTDFFANLLNFEEKNKFYQDLFQLIPGVPDETKDYYLSCPALAGSTVLLDNVGLYIENFSGTPYTDEENNTLMRFGKVFQQTYTRFLDLQKAEAQALEAIKRASVDRVRAEIASMRTTNDLERITPLIWNELTVLGIPFIRCGVFIMDEEQQQVQTFLYTEGKTIASFTSTYSNSRIITEALPYWRKKEIYKTHWDEAAFLEQAKSLVEQGAITSDEKYLTEHRPTDLYLHFFPFLQGLLYVGDAAALSEEHLQLVQALADAFSTAYARYEDFNKLEAAKQQVDKTLMDLKQTQTQLIQSEKMASLGELTAGIAHEIQNPLNFVNNFSEINSELIEELFEERNKAQGTRDEKLENEILNDIKENEKKINHHGKRADAIVKGMLQHSRSSTSIKEATNINKLAEEYLRLTYHGLRAKDKSFNVTMHTDFDETIPDINIIPQDIGRVLLNLYTNAFYAVNEKQKQLAKDLSGFKNLTGLGSYEPTITVSTKKSGNQVFITVSDNGNGIPQKIVDKIFQPFFTTKPTGQGTGLGLSLSYDIVKAHGGEIKVEAKVDEGNPDRIGKGEGSGFVIQLPIA